MQMAVSSSAKYFKPSVVFDRQKLYFLEQRYINQVKVELKIITGS